MTIDNVNFVIGQLEAINPNEELAYEKALLAYLSIKRLPVLICPILANETILFRSRTHETNNFFETISDVSIAPNEYVKSYARCNKPFQSKFYCSENRPTSYLELVDNWITTKNRNEKIYVTIGRWVLKTPMNMIIVTTPDEEMRISEFDKQYGPSMKTFIDNSPSEIREATIVLYRYLFNKFRASAKGDLKTYIITAAYCNLALMYSGNKAHGIKYPSVPFAGQGVNFAINYEFARPENLLLTHLFRNEISSTEDENGKCSFIETEIIESKEIKANNNIIEWMSNDQKR